MHDASVTRLLMFTGRECSHCLRMAPLVDAVERDTGTTIERVEVWHNEENAEYMKKHADVLRNVCGGVLGVPAFLNEATGEALCGEQDLDTLRAWAMRRSTLSQ